MDALVNSDRRKLLLNTLFGAGGIGLRALATGLPASFLSRPLEARAAEAPMCADKAKAQYLILSTSASGDPMNANVPGTYDIPDIVHAADPRMAATTFKLGSKEVKAAQLWSTLPQWVLDRTSFFHHGTFTNNHPNLPKVMRLMGATGAQEMLPSLFAKYLAPCFASVQREPLSVGAGDILTFQGRSLPNLPPRGLRDLLARPDSALNRLSNLRDRSVDEMYALLKDRGTTAQRQYLDALAMSRDQARSLSDELLGLLGTITNDSSEGQIIAAVAMCKMNVSPVVVIKIDFGGDNHTDPELMKNEVPQHETGIARIAQLFALLKEQGLEDRVTFAAYNVFGRTLKQLGRAGRNHWGNHHATIMIGKNVKPGVVGGLEPMKNDYAASGIDSRTGMPSAMGDIPAMDTLGAMGKTLGAALGVAPAVLDQQIGRGKLVASAVA